MLRFILLVLTFASMTAQAKTEDDYNRAWCETMDGGAEFMLLDRTRVDCMTETHSWEMDYAAKWYEGVGQALHYSRITGLKPGLVLIVKTDKDLKYVVAALRAIAHWELPIQLEITR